MSRCLFSWLFLGFLVVACAEPLDHAQAFTAIISIVDAGPGAVLDEQKVTIIVLGIVKSLNES